MDPFDVTVLPPSHLPLAALLPLLPLAVLLVYAWTALRDWWTTCPHGIDATEYVELPAECGLEDGVWCICRRCGDRTVITRTRMRELEQE